MVLNPLIVCGAFEEPLTPEQCKAYQDADASICKECPNATRKKYNKPEMTRNEPLVDIKF